MSLNLSGSLYCQALQVQKTIKLGEYNAPEKSKFTSAFVNSYEIGKIDSRPKFPESHKLDIIG